MLKILRLILTMLLCGLATLQMYAMNAERTELVRLRFWLAIWQDATTVLVWQQMTTPPCRAPLPAPPIEEQ
jgi:hypothetical protein